MLRDESVDFDRWWPEHDVSGFETRLRRFRHPTAGELTFEYQQLAPVEWPGLRVVAQLGGPRRRLRRAPRRAPLPRLSPSHFDTGLDANSIQQVVGSGSAPWRVTTMPAAA